MRIKWLHLSDIHFNFKNFDSQALREDFIDRIKELSQNEQFTHLILTGDILFGNQQADLRTIAFIKALIEAMGLSLENVILVPGNHDHNRQITIDQLNTLKDQSDVTIDSLDSTSCTSLLNAFENFYAVYQEVWGADYYDTYENPHTIYKQSSLAFLKINTAWLETDSNLKQAVRIGSFQLQSLLDANNKKLNNTVNIAVGHHPLDEFTPTECSRVLRLFEKHKIGLYLCGHTHRADIKIHRSHDVIEIIAPGGYVDNDRYSIGGYVLGTIDTDTNVYKAEIYNWLDGKWCINSTLPETDEYGFFYFNTLRFPHRSNITAVDCKLFGGHVPRAELEESLGVQNFDIHTYCGPYGDTKGFTAESVKEFSETILRLTENGQEVHLYPLAPIPMLLQLGYNLQNNSRLIIHQHDRNSGKWVYKEQSEQITTTCTPSFANNNILAVSISTSASIDPQLIANAMQGKLYDVLSIETDQIKLGFPLYNDDVCAVVQTIINELNPIALKYEEIHLFAAIPAGLAVELGRNLLASMYKNIYTYQLVPGEGYVQSLIINQVDSEALHTINGFCFTLDNASIVYVPILGRAPCGPLKEAITESDTCLPIPESILDNGDYYMLIADGNSMVDAGIEDGDYVLIKQQNTADEGDIIVAFVDGGTTIKRLHYDNDNQKYVLCPENPQHCSRSYNNIDIQGVAVKVIKNLKPHKRIL